MASIYERLREIIMGQFGVDAKQVVSSASFVDDFNADSSDLAEFIVAVEEEFSARENKLDISDEDAQEIVTVQDVIDYLRDLGIED